MSIAGSLISRGRDVERLRYQPILIANQSPRPISTPTPSVHKRVEVKYGRHDASYLLTTPSV